MVYDPMYIDALNLFIPKYYIVGWVSVTIIRDFSIDGVMNSKKFGSFPETVKINGQTYYMAVHCNTTIKMYC